MASVVPVEASIIVPEGMALGMHSHIPWIIVSNPKVVPLAVHVFSYGDCEGNRLIVVLQKSNRIFGIALGFWQNEWQVFDKVNEEKIWIEWESQQEKHERISDLKVLMEVDPSLQLEFFHNTRLDQSNEREFQSVIKQVAVGKRKIEVERGSTQRNNGFESIERIVFRSSGSHERIAGPSRADCHIIDFPSLGIVKS